ncbi:MAG: enoyl-CoA hydratase-related protein [Thermodesulfobacteriota bacterium]|nr:enoyl-CoA hydratase-related protein [Thermodesulfobacteriota bacterium]
MEFSTILFKKEEGIGTIILNRPEALNAINDIMIDELLKAFDEVAKDNDIRALVITGVGKAFCSGAQMKGEGTGLRVMPDMGVEGIRQGLRQIQMVTSGLYHMAIPTIAMLNGAAVGAGASMAYSCDLRVGSDLAKFRCSFTKVGIIPCPGDTWLLPRIIGLAKAAEMIFTADMIDAKEAERIGLLNKLVKADALEKETMDMARKIAQGPPIALKADKLIMHRGLQMDFDTTLEMLAAFGPTALTSEDVKEGILAFIEKRTPQFKGM